MQTAEYIVVGSGCTGAMAAQTLVEAGADVAMLDVGAQDSYYKQLLPDKDFLSIRREESEQYRYFLGRDFEGIPWGKLAAGAQQMPPASLSPPRSINFCRRFHPVSTAWNP